MAKPRRRHPRRPRPAQGQEMRPPAPLTRTAGPARSSAAPDERRALLDAVLHNLLPLAGVLLWNWSLSLLIAALWFELLFTALVLRWYVHRSRHGSVIVEPELARMRPDRPAPTLRRRSGEMLLAVGALGVFLGLAGISMAGTEDVGPLLGWTGSALAQAAVLGLVGTALALQRHGSGLRADRRDTLCVIHQRQSHAITWVIMILLVVPWFVLPTGVIGVLIAFFVARGAGDHWLARRFPAPA